MSYEAVISTLENVRPHPNADRLQLATCSGCDIIVGLDAKSGDVGVFFPSDGQLSEEYAKANDLIRRKDEQGNPAGGMFDDNRKVRTLKLRGEKSDGYFASLESLSFTKSTDDLRVGFTFNILNGIPICNKYVTPATQRAMSNQVKDGRRRTHDYFIEHVETDQFGREKKKIPTNAILHFTSKMHGTSFRFGNVLDDIEVKSDWDWLGKLFSKWFGFKQRTKTIREYSELVGSRRVILSKPQAKDWYGGGDGFRHQIIEGLRGKLHKGEQIFGEIVGFTPSGSPIMPPADLAKLKNKDYIRKYGNKMFYSYGCSENEAQIYVYRITQITEDGHVVDLSWNQVKKRCKQLGIKFVTEVSDPLIYDGNLDYLTDLVEKLSEQDDPVGITHIQEGIVIRIEHEGGTYYLKNKSFTFKFLEGMIKEDPNYVDIEESS